MAAGAVLALRPHAHWYNSRMRSHPQYIKPDIDPNESKAQFKICTSCCANLPLSSYTQNKYGRHGKDNACSECRKQGLRLRRKALYNAVSKIDDSVVRNVYDHNSIIVDLALKGLTCVAFNTLNKEDYKVVFSKHSRTDLDSMTIIKMDGSVLHEYLYSGVKDVKPILLSFLKELNLRLEMTEVHAMTSKNVIYWV